VWGWRSVANRGRARAFLRIFKKVQKKFKATLKFPKTPPLSVQDTPQSVSRSCQGCKKKLQKYSKIFAMNPKVPESRAVTGLDVAKKSQNTSLFFA